MNKDHTYGHWLKLRNNRPVHLITKKGESKAKAPNAELPKLDLKDIDASKCSWYLFFKIKVTYLQGFTNFTFSVKKGKNHGSKS